MKLSTSVLAGEHLSNFFMSNDRVGELTVGYDSL